MRLTPTQSARAYAIRTFGPFLVTMSQASQKQILRAYIAGYRSGQRKHRA